MLNKSGPAYLLVKFYNFKVLKHLYYIYILYCIFECLLSNSKHVFLVYEYKKISTCYVCQKRNNDLCCRTCSFWEEHNIL